MTPPAASPFSTAVPNVPPAPILRKRHLWSREEDKHLIWLIHQQGERWRDVAAQMPGRTARQCRERWVNFLAPQIKNTPWSPEEDSLLESLHNKYGAQWALISRMIEGRSAVQVKNRWNSLQRRPTFQPGQIYQQVQESQNSPLHMNGPSLFTAQDKLPISDREIPWVFFPIPEQDPSSLYNDQLEELLKPPF